MSESIQPTSVLKSLDQGVNNLVHNAQEGARRYISEYEDCVRKSPGTSLAAAVAVGYFLHHLPLRAIVNAKLRIISALAPPALFLFGAAKVYELIKEEAEAARINRALNANNTDPALSPPSYVD